MSPFVVPLRNARRNPLRAALTILSVAIVTLTFVLLRTVVWSWGTAVNHSASDRIATRHKVTISMPIPARYAQQIRETPGVSAAATGTWFGGIDPNDEADFISTVATDPSDLLEVVSEIELPPEQAKAWKENRRGAIIGDALAKRKGWELGSVVTLRGTVYHGDWEFEISGIYTSSRASVGRSTFFFNWEYLNQTVPPRQRDQVGWVISRIDKPENAAAVSRMIDAKFAESAVRTASMSERAFQASFLGMVSTIIRSIDVASMLILVIMLLVVGSAMAMGVRERTAEYGVLRAIGFVPKHIVWLVVGESVAVGAVGGVLGLVASYPLVERGIGRVLEENMGAFFPFFRIQPTIALLAMGLAIVVAAGAAIIPAYRASHLSVVDSLRHVA